MEQEHRDILRNNRMAICEQEFHLVPLLECLFKNEVLTASDKNSILSEKVEIKMKEKLLDILPKRGPLAFNGLLNALTELNLLQLKGVLTIDEGEVPQYQKVEEEKERNDTVDGPPVVKKMKKDNGDEKVDGRPLFGKKKSKDVSQADNGAVNLPRVYQMPDFIPENCYDMEKTPRGYFFLINNKEFLPSSGMEKYPRNGTDVDAEAIKSVFKELDFVIDDHHDLSVYQMRQEFKKVAKMDFSNMCAFACCVLSHGDEGILYGIDGTIDIKELTGYFRGQNLAGKPKIFFFQACQGTIHMDAVEADAERIELSNECHGNNSGKEVWPEEDEPESNDISLPTEADFLYAYSTVPGYLSWRDNIEGSWFIQAICEVFRQNAHKMDLVRMLTRVNHIVATKKFETKQRRPRKRCQIPSIITQLRKELYFFPPGPLHKY